MVLDVGEVDRVLQRIVAELVEALGSTEGCAMVGIRRGGVPIAQRLAARMEKQAGRKPRLGTVDIALYRDDAATALPDPKIGPSDISFDLDGTDVVLVDDVLQTGRTVRAAIDCVLDYGRPRRIWLAALIDRGGRELPVAADFVGRRLEVPEGDRLEVVEANDGLSLFRRTRSG